MPDLPTRLDLSWLSALGLLAACGPVAPQDTTDGTTDPSAGDPSSDASSEPTAPTSSTAPPPMCDDNADCADIPCGACFEGECIEYVGCCGYYGLVETADGWRCSPPPYYECYGDDDCPDGYYCSINECLPIRVEPLPACGPLAFDLTQWNLGAAPSAFVLADFDADLDLDLAAAQPGVAQIELSLNDGAGTFTLAGAFPVGEPTGDLALAGGDLDGDGDTDLVAGRSDGGLVLLFGQDAVFMAGATLPSSPEPVKLAVADVDGDGAVDIVAVSGGEPQVSVHRGDGLGGFAPAQDGSPQGIQTRAALADLDADGRVDLLAPIARGNPVPVWTGQPDGTFVAIGQFAAHEPDVAPFAGDLDADGDLEVVLASITQEQSMIESWQAASPGAWADTPARVLSVDPATGGVLAEFEAPAGADLILTTGSATLTMVLGDESGRFSCERSVDVLLTASPDLIVVGDVTGDGRPDIVTGSPGEPTVTYLRPL
jgi:hypothetical protein